MTPTPASDAQLAKVTAALAKANAEAIALNAMVPSGTTTPPDPGPGPGPGPGDPPPGTKLIYVSQSTGSDSNNGSIGAPYRTILKGFQAMTNAASAWCLLKRGDTWNDNYTVYDRYGGKNATERHVIGAYDSGGILAKPKINNQIKMGVGDHPMNFVTVRDIEFPTLGLQCFGYGTDIAFEDLTIVDAVGTAMVIQAEGTTKKLSNVAVRRCLIADLTGPSGSHVHGIYVWGVDGLTIEDNVIDRAVTPLTVFCHSLYIQAQNTSVVVRRNVLSRGASSNEMRSGGTIHDNLLLNEPNGFTLGCGTGTEMVAGGVVIDVRRNVHLGAVDIGGGAGGVGGKAMNAGNIKSGVITDNVHADGGGSFQRVLNVESGKGVGCLNLNFHHNIRRDWDNGVVIDPGGNTTGSTFTQTGEVTGAPATADLDLDSFGYADLYTALRDKQTTGVAVIAQVRSRMGMTP